MPKPVVFIIYHQCQVEQCAEGICRAALNCPRKVLRQENPFELPEVYPGSCRGCSLCALACPSGAVKMQ